jgi:hypothetical protein
VVNHTLKRAFILGCVVVVIGGFASLAPSVNAQTEYSVPKPFKLDRLVRDTFPFYFRGQRYPQLITEGFFPIGWSRDGKFAYYIEPVDEACGCYYGRLTIQDMRTDKVLWEFKYNQSDGMDEAGNMPPENTIAKLWAKNRKLFSDKLHENNIETVSRFTMLGRTFASDGRSFSAVVTAPPGKDNDGQERIKSVSLSLSSPKLGKKRLTYEDYKTDMYVAPLDADVIGAFKSPFENRVAVIMIFVNRGYEGPPNTADVRMVGADLFSGFSKGK